MNNIWINIYKKKKTKLKHHVRTIKLYKIHKQNGRQSTNVLATEPCFVPIRPTVPSVSIRRQTDVLSSIRGRAECAVACPVLLECATHSDCIRSDRPHRKIERQFRRAHTNGPFPERLRRQHQPPGRKCHWTFRTGTHTIRHRWPSARMWIVEGAWKMRRKRGAEENRLQISKKCFGQKKNVPVLLTFSNCVVWAYRLADTISEALAIRSTWNWNQSELAYFHYGQLKIKIFMCDANIKKKNNIICIKCARLICTSPPPPHIGQWHWAALNSSFIERFDYYLMAITLWVFSALILFIFIYFYP